MSQDYFATLPTDQIGSRLKEQIDWFYSFARTSGIYDAQWRTWRAYHGLSPNYSGARSDKITFGGEDGELSMVRVNHIRNLGQHLLNLTTSQRPAPQPVSANTDSRSIDAAKLSVGLLDYYARHKRVERFLRLAAEYSIVFSEGFVESGWDANAGKPFANDNGSVVKEGDMSYKVLKSLDVIRDVSAESFNDIDWVITRTLANKFEYAARYPQYKDDIISLHGISEVDTRFWIRGIQQIQSEFIPVWKFYHRRSDALPDGRLTLFLSKDIVLSDGPLPYRNIPVRRIAPGDLLCSPNGYTPLFDLLAIQEAIDALYSAIVTNQSTFGVQSIWVPESSNLSFEEISSGLNLFKTTGNQKPEPIQLTHTPQEIFQFIRQLEQAQETLSGINSVVRGNPEASLKSGSALALVQSQAIQFSSGLQASYAQLVEDVFTDTLHSLQDYANTKRVAMISGINDQYILKEYTGDDLKGVDRVVVEQVGSIFKTEGGRMQMAQDLLQNGMIKIPQEYINVINSGKLEPLTESQTRELSNIRRENERLSRGVPCISVAVDDHILHIKEHATVLANPDLRDNKPANQAIVNATMSHIMEHVTLGSDPGLMPLITAMGYKPIMPPLPPEQAAGGTPPGPLGAPPLGPAANLPATTLPNLPKPPINPASGQRWNPETGGLPPPIPHPM